MTNIARAHSLNAWINNSSPASLGEALSSSGNCIKLFDRYTQEVWSVVSERAVALGENVTEWLAEYFQIDLIDSLDLFKTLMARFACEHLALDLIRMEAA